MSQLQPWLKEIQPTVFLPRYRKWICTSLSRAWLNQTNSLLQNHHSFGHKPVLLQPSILRRSDFHFLRSWMNNYFICFLGRDVQAVAQVRNAGLRWKRMQTCTKWKPWVCVGLILSEQSKRSIQNWAVRKNENQTPPKIQHQNPHNPISLPSTPSTYSWLHIYTQTSSFHVLQVYYRLKSLFLLKSIIQSIKMSSVVAWTISCSKLSARSSARLNNKANTFDFTSRDIQTLP